MMRAMALRDGEARRTLDGIAVHTDEAWAGMRRAGRLAAECLDMLVCAVKPEITTLELDALAAAFARDHGAICAPLDYRGFPASICTSPNHVVCHGIPSERRLHDGDIVNIDVTLIVDGWHGDTSRMVPVGSPSRKAWRLMALTHEAMTRGLAAMRPGARLGDIGHAIQVFAEANRLAVVRDFCGHGLGRTFHDEPNVPHYGKAGAGLALEAGMFMTVEPMLNLGKPGVKTLSDGWTAVTRDRSLSAQFEHSVGVTADGIEVFTASPAGLDAPPYGTPA